MTKKLTKAQKAELASAVAVPEIIEPVGVEISSPEVTVPETEEVWVDPIKWVDETPTIDQAMKTLVTTKPHKVVKTVKTGVGAQILQHIADGVLSNKEIVERVLQDNPLRKTTYACVAWYKSQVRAGKIDLPEAQEEVMDECSTGMEDETLSDDQA